MSSPIDTLLSRLDDVRPTGDSRWLARCPAHEDRSPSLSVRLTGDGTVLLYDFAGCSAAEVLRAVGLDLADLFPPRETGYAARPTAPPIPWRDLIAAIEIDLTACSLAFRDLAAGKSFAPGDAAYIAARAEDLADRIRGVVDGR